MKALDTPVLLALLEGDASVKALLRRLRGVEIATTEANLLELSYLAAHGDARTRGERREVLERLRRKITVLPIDAPAVDQSGRHLGKGGERLAPLRLGMFGALEVGGCDELFSTEPPADFGKWKFKVTRPDGTLTK